MNDSSPQLSFGQDDFDSLTTNHDQNTLTHVRLAAIELSVFRQHIVLGGKNMMLYLENNEWQVRSNHRNISPFTHAEFQQIFQN